ncbi:MAG TPA: SRPBCC family protein [Stellaceae bacterium]|nr:SRPBCC family protein [Stellaceae bacterium]
MANVDMSVSLNATAEQVWSVIRGFDALPRWHPAVSRSEETHEGGKTRRKLTLHGGGEIVEELEQHSDGTRSYSYTILHSPLPVAGYRSELSVRDEKPGKCTVHWSSTFEPSGGSELDATAAIRGVYQAGFENLKKMFGG